MQGRGFQDDREFLRLKGKISGEKERKAVEQCPLVGRDCSPPGLLSPGGVKGQLLHPSDLSSHATSSERVTVPATGACLLISPCLFPLQHLSPSIIIFWL